jgi:two-component system response regulator HydG
MQDFREAENILKTSSYDSYYAAEILLRQAEASLELGAYEGARDLAGRALAMSRARGIELEVGHILRVDALARWFLGDGQGARATLRDAESHLRHIGDLYEVGRVLLARAEFLAETPGAAVAAAAEALNLFERMGVIHLADRARDLLAISQVRQRAAQAHAEHAPDLDQSRSNDPARSARTTSDAAAALTPSTTPAIAPSTTPSPAFDPIIDLSTGPIVAASPATREVLAKARTIAPHPGSVLLTGETGVGKDIIARFIHDHSARAGSEFVPVNCAAIPDTLFERELFGHARGSFTGADRTSPGLVEYANGGTLFLDEIGELPMPLQAKLLRLLQDGSFRRVGEAQERKVDVRVIAATNRDLGGQISQKIFREDLWFRLSLFELEIPPLRARSEDVIPLVHFFLERESRRLRNTFWMTKDAWQLIKRYGWPGNVRELESAIVSSTAQAGKDGCVHTEHLPRSLRGMGSIPTSVTLDLTKHLENEERRMILLALQRSRQSKAEAARYLGISRNSLYDKLKRLGIED